MISLLMNLMNIRIHPHSTTHPFNLRGTGNDDDDLKINGCELSGVTGISSL